jgi:penicillin-binding protein 1A
VRAGIAVVVLVAALFATGGIYLVTLPGVGDADARVDRILQMDLNAVYYGNGYWGDVGAARGYFGKNPGQLDWAQAAMLAGLPQAPSAYDPLQHYALAKLRQHHVLSQLVVNHALTERQADDAFEEPLGLR